MKQRNRLKLLAALATVVPILGGVSVWNGNNTAWLAAWELLGVLVAVWWAECLIHIFKKKG